MKIKAKICRHDSSPGISDPEYTFSHNPFITGVPDTHIRVGSKVMAIVRGRETEVHVSSLTSDYAGACNQIMRVVA